MSGVIGAVIMHKGGVGKTTTVYNLGHALSILGKRVLVVDLDPQSNTTSILYNNEDIRKSAYDLISSEDINVDECVYATQYKDLYILPNVRKTATLEARLFGNMPDSMNIIKNKLKDYAAKHYDITLIDNAPHLGVICVNSVLTSDFVIIPNETGSMFSIDGLNDAVEFAREIKNLNKVNLKFIKVLMTKVHKNYTAHKAAITQIKNFFPKNRVFQTIIPSNADIQKAEMSKRTIIAYRSNAIGAKAYEALASELIDELKLN